jgi:beta-phosphoglucomutase family hydrolase
MLGLPDEITACLFDLDGVLTQTAKVHCAAWKQMFDEFLKARDGDGYTPFDPRHDYDTYVDGKPRQDGVRDFLASRDIKLPDGSPDDQPAADTVYGLGNRKNVILLKKIDDDGVEVYEGSVRYLEAAVKAGLRRIVVSSSANTEQVLRVTGLDKYVEGRIDGVTLRERHIAGKPAPDSYIAGAHLAGVAVSAAAVFEDALAGVASGRAGKFGYVVGVNRTGQAEALKRNGADVVVDDLSELLDAGSVTATGTAGPSGGTS